MDKIDQEILTCFDDTRYAQLAYDKHEEYANNQPFPHMVFDNFLPPNVANAVAAEYPSVDEMRDKWRFHDNQNVSRFLLEDATLFSWRMKLFANAITSRSFLLFLETLTGLPALLPDPYFMGGGAMATGRGGFLNIHADFNWHQKLQGWRRCNALFYLTPNWKEEWAGEVEFWSTDGSKKVAAVPPLFNRMVVFTTTSESYHGQPSKILCPEGEYRRVFTAFYYRTERNDKTDEHPHFTKYNANNNNIVANKDNSPFAQGITEDYLRNVLKSDGNKVVSSKDKSAFGLY